MEVFIKRNRRSADVRQGIFWSDLDVTSFPAKLKYNIDAVVASIQNILLTVPGERFFNIPFGSSLGGMLFEPAHTEVVSSYKHMLINAITSQEPRVTIDAQNTQLFLDRDRGRAGVRLAFSLVGASEQNKYQYEFNL